MSINRFSRKSQESVLGKIIDDRIAGKVECMNALDFIESANGLNVNLFPVQRVIIRGIFGIPFDYRPLQDEKPKSDQRNFWNYVPVYDKFCETELYQFTEEEYLSYLYNEGRCNVQDWRDIPTTGVNEAAIFAGRRGGKSQIMSAIGSYVLYRLLNVESPQDYFGLVEGSPIDFTFLAQDDKGSSNLFGKLREDINGAPFFKPYMRGAGSSTEMTFVSKADRYKTNISPSIKVGSYPCTTNALRGPSSLLLVLDEFAHFRSDKNSNSEAVYEAATPATLFFNNPDGRREAMIMSISSPWKRVGKMYDIHTLAMAEGIAGGVFTMRVGTAEMNPSVDTSFLKQKFKTGSLTWKAEYGGEFLDSSESYVSMDHITQCVDTGRKNIDKFAMEHLGKQFFWGLDLGMANDATALAIGHLEVTKNGIELIYDYIDRMMVGELFSGPGVPNSDGLQRYVNHKELDLEEIGAWLLAMHNILPCYRGMTDQHGGRLLVQLLHILGITKMELKSLNGTINSQMYLCLKGYIDQGMCKFPEITKFVHELRTVEASFSNKYQIRVESPEEKGQHDDMCDAVALVAYQAQEWLELEGRLKLDPTGQSIIMQQQMALPPKPLLSIDGVSLRDMQVRDRMQKLQRNVGYAGNMPVSNPFRKR